MFWFRQKKVPHLPMPCDSVTIVGFEKHYGQTPFDIGRLIRCEKEPENPIDSGAIRACLPSLGTVGYISNNYLTKAKGTYTADRIYDKVKDVFYVRVWFTTRTKIICHIENITQEQADKEIMKHIKRTY